MPDWAPSEVLQAAADVRRAGRPAVPPRPEGRSRRVDQPPSLRQLLPPQRLLASVPLAGSDTFLQETGLDAIWRRYTFDRRLRLLVLDAVERVEIAIRTDLTYCLAHAQGPFGFTSRLNLPNLDDAKYARFIAQIEAEYANSKEPFIRHFREQYGVDHELPPYWIVTELMTFGTLLTMFKGAPTLLKQQIGRRYRVSDSVLESWLGTINVVRNICAHHGRLWNRELGFKPKIPRHDPRWRQPVMVAGGRVFVVLTILKYMLDEIAPQSRWPARLNALLAEYPDIPLHHMAFPTDWRLCPIWAAPSTEGPTLPP